MLISNDTWLWTSLPWHSGFGLGSGTGMDGYSDSGRGRRGRSLEVHVVKESLEFGSVCEKIGDYAVEVL